MTRPVVELAVERVVLEGIAMAPEQSAGLVRRIEERLRRALAGGLGDAGSGALLAAKPVALAEPADLDALADAVAERVVAEVAALAGPHD